MEHQLALVIPAYKKNFFRSALESIAQQSDKRFTLYIGDDNSPDNLKDIVDEFQDKISIKYHHFQENLGSKSLTKHWNRCVKLIKNETYVWLFSDDDIMPADAVERFYKTIEKHPNFSVYRFNLQLINATGKCTSQNTMQPSIENGFDFVLRRMKVSVHSAVIEFIFRRDIFNTYGGYINFPLAWASDTATYALFSGDKGIKQIDGNAISWRTGDSTNISSSKELDEKKFQAQISFIEWVYKTYTKQIRKYSSFNQLVYRYLKFICGRMFKGNISTEQFKRIREVLQIENSAVITQLLLTRLKFYLKIHLPLQLLQTSIIRRIKSFTK